MCTNCQDSVCELPGFIGEVFNTDSYPPSSKIHIQFPVRGDIPPVELIWYDGEIKPRRPDELLPDEPMGHWDGENMIITAFEPANQFVSRKYREEWKL